MFLQPDYLCCDLPAPVAHDNAYPEMAPHGCYPCANGERISIAEADDVQWSALAGELPLSEASFGNMLQRLVSRHALHQSIVVATQIFNMSELAVPLQ